MTGQNNVTATPESLIEAAKAAQKEGRHPPVHLWTPEFCGDLDMEIKRDGTWFYMGTPIGRFPLVKLFASILKVEDGKHYLVTPVEKVGIRVRTRPSWRSTWRPRATGRDQVITFTTNVEDVVIAGPRTRSAWCATKVASRRLTSMCAPGWRR